jgi:hypothetical protein
LPWSSAGGDIRDETSKTFVFSLINAVGSFPLGFPLQAGAESAIACDASLDPTFAWGAPYDWGSFQDHGAGNLHKENGVIQVFTGRGQHQYTETEVAETTA